METPEPVDNTASQEFLEGKLEGYFETHELIFDAILRLKQSLNDTWEIENHEAYQTDGREDKHAFAHNTLSVLGELFIDEYDSEVSRIKNQIEISE